MLPTKFRINWPCGFRGEDFRNRSIRNKNRLWRPCLFMENKYPTQNIALHPTSVYKWSCFFLLIYLWKIVGFGNSLKYSILLTNIFPFLKYSRQFYFCASNVTAKIAKIKLPRKLPGLTVPFCLSRQQEFWVVPCFYHQSIDLNKPSDIDYNHLDSVKHDNSLTSSNTDNKYSSSPLTRVPYLQWHRGFIRGVASLDVRQFASILLSQCIWNLAW